MEQQDSGLLVDDEATEQAYGASALALATAAAPWDAHERLRQHISLASVTANMSVAQDLLSSMQGMVAGLHESVEGAPGMLRESAIGTVPRWHFSMLNDFGRNDAFADALEQVVPAGAHVVDIGSGSGLLAMMAARAGAASVTTCESNPLLAELARQIIAQHGLDHVITVVPKISTELRVGVDLPRRADVVVSEILDCGLVGEGVLPTVRHAREHLLKPGGVLLPCAATLNGALVESSEIDGLNRVRTAAGFDVRLLNEVSTTGHYPVRLSTWPHRLLSEPAELASFDFAADTLQDGHHDLLLPVIRGGHAHAVVAWFELTLAAGVVLSNAPRNLTGHWMQAFVPFREAVAVEAGQTLQARLAWHDNQLSVQHVNSFSSHGGQQ